MSPVFNSDIYLSVSFLIYDMLYFFKYSFGFSEICPKANAIATNLFML